MTSVSAKWSFSKSSIFFSVGHIAQIKGSQRIAAIRGLTQSHPKLGWSLALGVLAIAGLPPFGVFLSEFLVVTSTFARAPGLALLLVLGLLLAFGALILRLTGFLFGEPEGSLAPAKASFVPIWAHMGLVLLAGIHLPGAMVAWFEAAAKLLG